MIGWRKSSHCSTNTCIEVARWTDGWITLRDSERPGEMVRTSPESWRAFLAGIRGGEFDLS